MTIEYKIDIIEKIHKKTINEDKTIDVQTFAANIINEFNKKNK